MRAHLELKENLNLKTGHSDIDSDFLINRDSTITALLATLVKQKTMVSVLFYPGDHFLLTLVLEINSKAGTLTLDYGSNQEVNRQLLASDFKVFMAKIQGVIIEFFFEDVRICSFEGGLAFQVDIPDKLVRMEHRQFHRIRTPVINPLTCIFPDGHDSGINSVLVDISLTGMCVSTSPSSQISLEPGRFFRGCLLDLPGVGKVELTVMTTRIWDGPALNGVKPLMFGCSFVGLTPRIETMIERYINKSQIADITKKTR